MEAAIKLAEGLFWVDNLMPRNECRGVVAGLERATDWNVAKVLCNINQTARKAHVDLTGRKQQCMTYDDRIKSIHDAMNFSIKGELDSFIANFVVASEHHKSSLGLKSTSGIDLLAYQKSGPGDFFHWHRDNVAGLSRTMSVLCYLSDFDSHKLMGGTTEFLVDDEIVEVTPRMGSAVVFNPNIGHRGLTVDGGLKYCVLCIYK